MHKKVGLLTAGAMGVVLLVPFGSLAKAPTQASHPKPAVAAAAARAACPPPASSSTRCSPPTATISLPVKTKSLTPKVTWTVATPSGSTINGYFLSETNTDPLVGDAGWVPTKPANFTFPAGDGTRTLYAWVKDHNDKVSAGSRHPCRLDTTAAHRHHQRAGDVDDARRRGHPRRQRRGRHRHHRLGPRDRHDRAHRHRHGLEDVQADLVHVAARQWRRAHHLGVQP